MALSKPFLTGTILFSSISPDMEENLKEELFGCFKYVGIPIDILEKMPVRDRKYYIKKYNEYMDAKNKAMSGDISNDITGGALSEFTDQSQGL